MEKLKLSSLFLPLIYLSCSTAPDENVQLVIDLVRTEYAPDTRTAIFQVQSRAGNPAVFYGETNLPDAKAELLARLAQNGVAVIDSIRILPDPQLEKPFALINVSVANLRTKPEHSAELATQALLGTPVQMLETHRGWCRVQTPDKYIAWTNEESLQLVSLAELDKWKNSLKVIYTSTTGFALDTLERQRVSDLVAGNILALYGEKADSWIAGYPDGRRALVRKDEATDWNSWVIGIDFSDSSILQTAYEFIGIPYQWGGTSAKGLDCSGFTKTVYMLQGIVLPRDASQQVHVGSIVDSLGNFQNLKIGDLLFFGSKKDDRTERVVHVGLWLGNRRFIHASGDVHISSLDSTSADFDQYNLTRYLRTTRITSSDALPMTALYDLE